MFRITRMVIRTAERRATKSLMVRAVDVRYVYRPLFLWALVFFVAGGFSVLKRLGDKSIDGYVAIAGFLIRGSLAFVVVEVY